MTSTEDLAAVVQRLRDERDVVALATRYASAVDARDWGRFRECFTPQAVGEYTQLCEGRDRIEAHAREWLTPLSRTQHAVSNFEVQLDGDRGTHQCYVTALHVLEGCPHGETFTIIGQYRDDVVRTPDGWRIARRRLDRWRLEGNPRVLGQ